MGESEAVPGVDLAAPTRDTLSRGVLCPAWLVTAVAIVPFLVGVSVPLTVQAVPLVVSVVLFGLPHGAIDHLALPRVRGEGVTWRGMGLVVLVYLVLGTLYGAVWFLAPAVAFAFFICTTWFHWGQGDLYSLLAFTEVDYLETRLQRALAVVVRGGLPMLVPLLAFPEWYRRVAAAHLALFDAGALDGLSWLFALDTRLALGGGYGLVVVGHLALGYVRADRDRSAWAVDAGETLLLAAYFLTVPPLLAVGLYFCCWHALRHIARLVLLAEPGRSAVRTGEFGSALRRFAVEATPLTLVSLLLLGGLWALVPRQPGNLLGLLALYLVLIAVLTLPHVAIVTWMDREQSVWVV